MSLRAKILLYYALVHLLFAVIAALVLREERLWLIVMELLLAASLLVGYLLFRSIFVPLDLIGTGAELIAERDFSSKFREVGQPELDRLVRIYNEMIERLREERLKLEEQNIFLDRIIEGSPSAIITCDYDGRISEVNPAAESLLGKGHDELIGRTVGEMDHPLATALSQLQTGRSQIIALAGGRRLRCRRLEFVDRGFSRASFLIDELTAELRASERAAYDKLIRMISHEVNNSVGAVRSLLESCLNYSGQLAEEDRSDFRNALTVASARLENLNRFTNGFADFVRIPPPELRPVSLPDLVRDLLLLLRTELEGRAIRTVIEIEDDLELIPIDKNQIEQVLMNVLKNAIEAIGRDGTIAVQVKGDGPDQMLSIADSGPGIAPEVQGQLFTPFFSTKKDGRGLGLTVIQEILMQHGFDFSLQSENGGGARFRIVFRDLRTKGVGETSGPA